MWPVIIGIGIAALIAEAFSDDDSDNKEIGKGSRKKIFVSFAIEDETYRNHLVNQARSEKSPFDFVDMSVKQPWNEDEWKKTVQNKD